MSLTSTKANSELVLGTAIQGELTISNSTINSFDVVEDLTGVTTVYVLKSGDVDYTSVTGTYSGGTFTYDSALSSPAIAASDESKWVDEEVTYSYKPKEITLESSTTTTSIESLDEITTGDSLLVYNATDGMVERTAGTVTTTVNDIVSSTDPFGDGSAVATYNLDANTNDLGGNYNLTHDGTGVFESGYYGNCFTSNGGNADKLKGDLVIPSLDSFAISFWIKHNTSNNTSYITSGDNTSNYVYFYVFGNKPNFYGAIDGTGHYLLPDTITTINNNEWTHFVVSGGNSSSFIVYKNGVSIHTSTDNMFWNNYVKFFTNSTKTTTGAVQYGSIDQVRIFNKSLTSTEITSLYNETVTLYQAPITATTIPATKAFFKQNLHTFLSVEDTEARCIVEPKEVLNIDSSSTVSSLVTTNELYEGETLYLNDGGTLVERTAGIVTTASGLVSSTDPFGDGSLIAKYELDGNANDTGGNYNGTVIGSVSYSSGKFNNAIVFPENSSSNYITTPYRLPLSTDFTCSAWVKLFNSPAQNEAIFTQSSGGTGRSDILSVNKTTGGIYIGIGTTGNGASSNEAVPRDGEYHHLVVVRDTTNSTFKLYIDGTECTYSSNVNTGADIDNADLWIGRYASSSTNNQSPNSIDQIEIYNRALTPSEVNTLYTQTTLKYQAPIIATTNIPTSGYKLGEKALTVTGTPTTTTISATATESGLISIGDEIVLEGVE
jgi:hypothetical protein